MSTQPLLPPPGGATNQPLPPVLANTEDDTGLSGLVRLKPSRLVLVQPTTLETSGAGIGQILDQSTGEAFDSVKLVILKVHQSRAMYPPGQQVAKGAEPVCRSDDAIRPADNAKVKQANFCATCPKGDVNWQSGNKPPCAKKLEMLAVTTEDGMPHYITASGRSVSRMIDDLDKVQRKIMIARNKGENVNLRHYEITVRGFKTASPFPVMGVDKFTQLSGEDAAKYNDLFSQIKSRSQVVEEVTNDQAVDNAIDAEVTQPEEV